jgi:hypothetical protein
VDETKGLSDSLKMRSWKERAKSGTNNQSSLTDIKKFYSNLQKEAEKANNSEHIEEQIRQSKEQLLQGHRTEVRDATDEESTDEAEEKRERMRVESVTEMLLSERYYVRDLETIVHVSE